LFLARADDDRADGGGTLAAETFFEDAATHATQTQNMSWN